MTDHLIQTLSTAIDPDSVSTAPSPSGSADPLDGAWFRRERERLAVGRRFIAQHLQVAEGRVTFLETRRHQVPASWLPLIATLGFRVPSADLESTASALDNQKSASSSKQASVTTPPVAAESAGAPQDLPAARLPSASQPHQADEGGRKAAPEPTAPSPTAEQPVVKLAPAQSVPTAIPRATPTAPATTLSPAPATRPAGEPAPAALPLSLNLRERTPVPPRTRQAVDGGWLQAERQRLGLSRNFLRLLLNIHWATCAKVENQKLPVPRRWWSKLTEIGFHFPSKSTPKLPIASPASPASPAPPVPPASVSTHPAAGKPLALSGAWLRRERKRLGLSDKDVWTALQVHWRTLTVVEQRNRVIPAAWLPALHQLGMTYSPPKAQPEAAAPVVPAAPDSSGELFTMIVKYRLTLGRRSGQSAVETMALIAHDLRTANLSQIITHDQLAAVMDSLLRSR